MIAAIVFNVCGPCYLSSRALVLYVKGANGVCTSGRGPIHTDASGHQPAVRRIYDDAGGRGVQRAGPRRRSGG